MEKERSGSFVRDAYLCPDPGSGFCRRGVDADTASDALSVGKTATNLVMIDDEESDYDGYYMSDVTLTIPSVEENEVYDIVFVLDKSTSPNLLKQAEGLVEDLQAEVSGSDAVVKVAVVIFNKQATTFGFYDLETELDEIEEAINYSISSGTNTHAGLLAAQALLDEDTSVDAENKYMIFVSDGITYMYDADYTVTAWGFYNDGYLNTWSGPSIWGVKFKESSGLDESSGDSYIPTDWESYLESVGEQYAKQQAETNSDGSTGYEYTYGGTVSNYTDPEKYDTYVNSVEIALYKTYTVYQEMVSAGYNCCCVTANTGSGSEYAWGPSFMKFLAGGEEVTFEDIENEILYFVDSGSTVVDYMGYVEDDYDFDFVDSASYLTLSVGSTTYEAVDLGSSTYGFKAVTDEDGETSYAFELVYEKGNGTDEEKFTLYIYEAVSYFNPLKLTYSVILTNPKEEAGTYGTYDEDGSEGYTSLYTNSSATLYPVNTDGESGVSVAFPMPTVSYTVVNVTVTKVWDDNDNADGLRPDSVTVELYADGEATGNTLVLSEDNDWTATFGGLAAYRWDEDGSQYEISYSVEEIAVDGYDASLTDASFTLGTLSVTITNTHEVTEEETTIEETTEEETTIEETTGEETIVEETTEEETTEETAEGSEETPVVGGTGFMIWAILLGAAALCIAVLIGRKKITG